MISGFSRGVNLLPPHVKRELRVFYAVRLASASMFLLGIGVAMSGALVIPSYLLARAEAETAERYLAASERSVALGAQGGAGGVVALLAEELALLREFPRRPQAAAVLSALTADLPRGVSLSYINIIPAEDTGAVSVSGKAATRDALLDFIAAVQGKPLFRGVAVPVSALASEEDIEFTLSFSFTLSTP